MSKTYQLRQIYGQKHVLHPFLFQCMTCSKWIRCSECLPYVHNMCDICMYLLEMEPIGSHKFKEVDGEKQNGYF